MVTFQPIKLFPDRRAFPIVLKISQGIMPVARHRDFFACQAPAVLQSALANNRFQACFAEVGAKSKIVLPCADQDYIPLDFSHVKFPHRSKLEINGLTA